MSDGQERDILTVTTTVGSEADAKVLARAMVERRLAACVQLDRIEASVYRWEGAVCEEAEWRLTAKSLPALEAALQALVVELHPYELPQFVSTTARASPAYAGWVRSEVTIR